VPEPLASAWWCELGWSALTSGAAFVAWALIQSSASLAFDRVEVPIKQTALSDGEIRYSIPANVGASSAIDAMLDTGSSGLRVLLGAVPESAYSVTGQASVYGYGSGVRFTGVIANSVITIGGPPPTRQSRYKS
jgi:hypothetical protein